MGKETRFTLRISEKERRYLETQAKESGLSLGEYIRTRVMEKELASAHEDQDQRKQDLEQYFRMLKYLVSGYYLVGKIARHLELPESDIKDALKRADDMIKEWNHALDQ